MSEVNAGNMSRWIVALRSGKYKQSRGQLHTDDGGYCCLGLLCEISGMGRWNDATGPSRAYVVGDEQECALPPFAVADWLGSTSRNPQLLPNDSCSNANDISGLSFNQIADALEERYLKGLKAEEILKGA